MNLSDLQAALLAHVRQTHRLLRLNTPLGPDVLVPETMRGVESIGDGGFCLEVIAVSLNAAIDLGQLLAQPVTLGLLTDKNRHAPRVIHAHVTVARALGADGGLARYALTLEPWLAFLRERRDSWVFQDKTVFEIVDELLADWRNAKPIAAQWRWDVADRNVYAKRSLTVQYDETDAAFLNRLLAEEGLFYWFEHAADAHVLVIADHNGAFKPAPSERVRYTRAADTQTFDSIQAWRPSAKMLPHRVDVSSWDYKTLSLRPVSEASGLSVGYDAVSRLDLAISDVPTTYAYADRDEGNRLARQHMQALDAERQRIDAEGTVRDLSPGTHFVLDDHPRYASLMDDEQRRFVVIRIEHDARNNITTGMSDVLKPDHDYRQRLRVHPMTQPWRSASHDEHGIRLHPKPTVRGAQTAIVVAEPDQPLHTERDHRVKVQFHWQRGNAHPARLSHSSTDDNAPADASLGTWVRVMTPLAGANWGGVLIPRKGQEVLVEFLDGDIDRPVIVGALYNGQGDESAAHNRRAGTLAATANAPDWHGLDQGPVLSGIRTQSLDASQTGHGGHNQLVFDDTPNAARLELSTTHAATRLQLGHLKHQEHNKIQDHRGYGSELLSEAAVAIRAGNGLLLSTENGRGKPTLTSMLAQTQLADAASLTDGLHKAALHHQADGEGSTSIDRLPVHHANNAARDELKARQDGHDAWTRPHLALEARDGLAAVTPNDAQLVTNAQWHLTAQAIDIASQGEWQLGAREGLRFFTLGQKPGNGPVDSTGMSFIAARGLMSVRVHDGGATVDAKQTLTISSTDAGITMEAPERLVMTAAGGYIKFEGGNIEVGTPGEARFAATQKNWTSPQASSAELSLPKGTMSGCEVRTVLTTEDL
ncbi:MAG TPA: type VI secretion system Vgr family protein [Burkholderiaceae bacterium]|nr:type VI secretion system Vgr family protein [Burkholderiaceae bacterium]